jgi:hypothetical protein
MKLASVTVVGGLLACSAVDLHAQAKPVRAVVSNELDLARREQMVEVPASALSALGKPSELLKVKVREQGASADLLSQAVDLDGDAVPDQVVFLADFAPRQSRTFELTLGDKRVYRKKEDYRVYGRFNRERWDDFAWENDRVAHRVYGAALETWDEEPLTGSGVDVWLKRTRRLVLNDWYLTEDYHADHGEGADFYSAGRTRGCGGTGLWRDGKLYTSRNFRKSRVLASGPLRLVFELEYEPFEAGNASVGERKRVIVDAGQHLQRFESLYRPYRRPGQGEPEVTWVAGLKKDPKSTARVERAAGIVRTWEPVAGEGNGNMGCGVVLDPARIVEITEADGNHLVVAKVATGQPAVFYAGSGWDKGGDFAALADWDRHLDELARRVASPLKVEVR